MSKQLKRFKESRKFGGTIYALLVLLSHSGVQEHRADQFVDAVSADLGVRQLEKMKTKDLYEMVDGFVAHEEEHLLTYQH